MQLLIVDEPGQLAQLRAIGLDNEVAAANIVSAALAVRRLGDGHQDPAGARHPPGPGHGVTADGIYHHIDVAELIFEPAGVVDDLPGTQTSDVRGVAGRRCRGYSRAVRGGELDSVGADAPAAAVDKDMLAGPQVRVLMQGLPRGERAERDGRRGDVVGRSGFRGQGGGRDGRVLGGGTGPVESDQPETSSPWRQRLTPGPAAATTPDRSWHGMAGHASGQVSSPAVTAVARTCTSTSPRPGLGTGTRW